ncbi:leucine-rich repeat-containing protein 48 [Chrysochromulina tobinii]|uniref:Leucine-rich repeat-containing protein 48 n=1 Tax=Chrysochromulina tobinii TaxID=1460289 RepID=A0A0M0LQH9_9EUKA|nr:leucine-rich repeat-containing protein 48 [Chrysochromulina tobinii]|eukprot:KOO53325.1 leucine-rich repeat-containing protein 48 [Chrysochromulina sp. CCMP291]
MSLSVAPPGSSAAISRALILEVAEVEDEAEIFELSLHNKGLRSMLGLSRCVRLRVLDLSFNGIQCVEGLDALIDLRELRLYANELVRVDGLGRCVKLQAVLLHDNRLGTGGGASRPGTAAGGATILSCFAGLTQLATLRLDSNPRLGTEGLARLRLDQLPALADLDVSSTRVGSVLPFVALRSLQQLRAEHNELRELVPLASLSLLEELHLGHNELRGGALAALAGLLEVLDLSHNSLLTLESVLALTRKALPELAELRLTGNAVCAEPQLVAALRRQLHTEKLLLDEISLGELAEAGGAHPDASGGAHDGARALAEGGAHDGAAPPVPTTALHPEEDEAVYGDEDEAHAALSLQCVVAAGAMANTPVIEGVSEGVSEGVTEGVCLMNDEPETMPTEAAAVNGLALPLVPPNSLHSHREGVPFASLAAHRAAFVPTEEEEETPADVAGLPSPPMAVQSRVLDTTRRVAAPPPPVPPPMPPELMALLDQHETALAKRLGQKPPAPVNRTTIASADATDANRRGYAAAPRTLAQHVIVSETNEADEPADATLADEADEAGGAGLKVFNDGHACAAAEATEAAAAVVGGYPAPAPQSPLQPKQREVAAPVK